MHRVEKQLSAAALWLGAVSPFLYAAAQLLGAPLYKGYDWKSQLASELGSVGTASSGIFNVGMVLSGLAMMASAVGFKLRLACVTRTKVVPWSIAASLASSGAASVWAGLHPLPSLIHNPGYWGIGAVAFPPLLAVALWRSPVSPAMRAYLAGSAIAIVAFLFFSSGLVRIDTSSYDGVLQRLGAFLVHAPVAVGAITILRMKSLFNPTATVSTAVGKAP